MKLLISIVPRGISDEVAKITGGGIIDYQTTVPGLGTATSEILEYFCLGETERDVIFSLIDDTDIPNVFRQLTDQLDFLRSGMGVAFTVSLDGISKLGYSYLYGELSGVKQNGK